MILSEQAWGLRYKNRFSGTTFGKQRTKGTPAVIMDAQKDFALLLFLNFKVFLNNT